MKKEKNVSADEWQGIVKSTREWLVKNNTAIIFATDGDTIEDIDPVTLDKDLTDFGY